MNLPLTSKLSRNATLRESIADSVREAIIQGALKPGTKLSEPELAKQFGISRTPIREAFRQLDSEGFLKIIPRRGARVVPLTEKDVVEFYEVKAVLEGHAARLAMPRLTVSDLNKMEHLNNEMERFHREGDFKGVFKLHNDFHEVFLRACGNEYLYQLLQMLISKFQRFRMLLSLTGRSEGSIAQHREIIGAFREKNIERAARLVTDNALLGREIIIGEILKQLQ